MYRILIPVVTTLIGGAAGMLLSERFHLTSQGLQYRAVSQFADGSIYAGPLNEEGLAEGSGTITWGNGDVYEGEFQQGVMHGKGVLSLSNGSHYEGHFANGEIDGQGTMQYANGSEYEGELHQGMMHGQGRLSWSNGDHYEGEFQRDQINGSGIYTQKDQSVYRGEFNNGKYHGQGTIEYHSGDRYQGGFIHGQFHGTGNYVSADGDHYQGEFSADSLNGKGSWSKEGATYVGEFQDWQPHGKGIMTDKKGNQWQGEFDYGYLSGQGEYIGVNGERYKGEFEYHQYEGKGEHWSSDGEHYQGEFSYGVKNGTGELSFTDKDGKAKVYRGNWRNGSLVSANGDLTIHSPETITEHALYQQVHQLEQSLAAVQSGDQEKIELFTLALAPYGAEEVFSREIRYIEKELQQRLSSEAHSIFLSNSRRDLESHPLATLTSVEKSLQTLGSKMNSDQDILFLYISSHGSQDWRISFQQPGLRLQNLDGPNLNRMLDESGIKWKVIVLSACYSGGFIDDLADDNTIVITAAAKDRTSFGCADDRDFTYFGKAFFKDALPQTMDFVRAFELAKEQIDSWESDENKTPSQPQISVGKAIKLQLANWQSQKQPSPDTTATVSALP